MEEGWREVRRRSRHESFPARHHQQPNLRRNPDLTTEGLQREGRPREGEATFFFNNFPDGTRLDCLTRIFNKIGKVTDIFCPKKKDIKGKPFGFVRFEEVLDKDWYLKELNNIWIGSYKMRSYIPRFERPKKAEPKAGGHTSEAKENRHLAEPKRNAYKIPLTSRKSGISFVEALGVSKKPNAPLVDEIPSFQSSEEDTDWLYKAFTGFVKTEYAWEEFGEEIKTKCIGNLNVTSLGGNLVLIQSNTHSTVQEVLEGLDEWKSFWFEWVRPWSYVDVSSQRIVWTKWYGVPLQAWNQRFFDSLGERMGMVHKVHEATKNRDRLDFAFVQFSTGFSSLNKVVECRINGAHFKIRIEEVADQQWLGASPTQEELPESEEESTSDEEDDLHSFQSPAKAQIGGGTCTVTNGDEGDSGFLSVQQNVSSPPITVADFSVPQKDCMREVTPQSFESQFQELTLSKEKSRNQRPMPTREPSTTRVCETPSAQLENEGFSPPGPLVLGPNPALCKDIPPARHSCEPNLAAGSQNSPLHAMSPRGPPFRMKSSHKKKVRSDFPLKLGLHRFLQKRSKSTSSKPQPMATMAVVGFAPGTEVCSSKFAQDQDTGRDAQGQEGVASKSNISTSKEGEEIWEFGKNLGLHSNLSDKEMANLLEFRSGKEGAEAVDNNFDQ